MIIAGMIRVKNGARWIGECLSQLHAVCDHIYILDDHSTDDTVRTCGHSEASYPGRVTVFPTPFDGLGLDETRDKNWLLHRIIWSTSENTGHLPDWIVAMDADEALIYPDHLLDALCSGKADAYSLHFLFLHDNPNQVRVDGVYRDYCRPSAWRVAASNGVFRGSGAPGGLHCGSIPNDIQGRAVRAPNVHVKHYGPMLQADRIAKYRWFRKHDPNNDYEDNYRHSVIGDLPEFPVYSQFKWGGPLRVLPLEAWLEFNLQRFPEEYPFIAGHGRFPK